MEKLLKQFLLNKGERNALILIMLLLLLSYGWMIFKSNSPQTKKTETLEKLLIAEGISEKEIKTKSSQLDQLISENSKKIKSQKSNFKKNKSQKKVYKKKKAIYKKFDPHNVDSITFRKMNLPPYVFTNLKNYRNKGGKFFRTEDLKKIYGLEEEDYHRIKSYCIISKAHKIEKTKPQKQEFKKVMVNINEADTAGLKSLYGIGSKLASRIIKYRNNIGGFHKLEQLTEVYGVEAEVLSNNEDKLVVSGEISKVNINNVSYEALQRHYYFDRKLAKILINYRDKHGNFENIPDLKNIKILSDSIYTKIEPYCTI